MFAISEIGFVFAGQDVQKCKERKFNQDGQELFSYHFVNL